MTIRLHALLALVIVGCGTPGAGSDAGADRSDAGALDAGDAGRAREPWEIFVDELARASCELEIRCLAVALYEVPPDRLVLCHPHALDRARIEIAAELRAGRTALDEEAARACLAELARRDCAVRTSGEQRAERIAYDACRGVFRALTSIGDRCVRGDSELVPVLRAACPDGAYCPYSDATCDRVCRAYRAEGESCAGSTDLRCAPGLLCLAGTCAGVPGPAAAGDPCVSTADCRGGRDEPRRCVDGSCSDTDLLPAGSLCADWECARGLWCSPADGCTPEARESEPCDPSDRDWPTWRGCSPDAPYCVDAGARPVCAREPLGASCTDRWWTTGDPCLPLGLVCRSEVGVRGEEDPPHGRCLPRVPAGGLCHDHKECTEGLGCIEGACTALASPGGECGADAVCPISHACVSGACVARPRAGEPCDAERQCHEGTCVSGACTWLGEGDACVDRATALDRPACPGSCSAPIGEVDGTCATSIFRCRADLACPAGSFCSGLGGCELDCLPP